MLAVAWGPLIIVPIILRPLYVDLMGFAMAWGFVVTLPLTVVGALTLIGGIFALFRTARD
jgi:hypothetical protein